MNRVFVFIIHEYADSIGKTKKSDKYIEVEVIEIEIYMYKNNIFGPAAGKRKEISFSLTYSTKIMKQNVSSQTNTGKIWTATKKKRKGSQFRNDMLAK